MTYSVAALLKEQAGRNPDRLALVFARGDRRLTFAELDRLSDRYAAGFRGQQVGKGDRVLFLMRPSLDLYAVLFGVIKLGAVPVLVDPGMGLGNVLACVAQIRPDVVVAMPLVHAIRTLVRAPFASARLHVTAGRRWFWGGRTLAQCLGPDAPFELAPFAAEDEVGIVFTSGSTGTPKGVTYTHGIFHAVARLAGDRLGRIEGRTNLETFAAYVLFDVAQGMTAVVPDMDLSKPAKADPARIAAAIARHRPQAAFASPVVLRNLTSYCREQGLRLDSLRDVLTGVAPIPGSLHHAVLDVAPDATLHVTYGATESMTCTHVETGEVLGETWAETTRGAGNCVGRPFDGMTVRIVRITDDPIPAWSDDLLLPPGEIGEIVAEGPVVSAEYKDRPDANAAAKIRRGETVLHRMGDLGYLDDQGRLWFCGRKAHRLETARGMVPAVCVEHVFNEHPDVARTALVGVGRPEVPALLVELAPGRPWRDELPTELLRMAIGTRWEGVVAVVLHHPGPFPVDARHNSKIRREALKAWANARPVQIPDVTREVA